MDRRLLMLAMGMFAMGTDNFVVAGILPSVAQSLDVSVSAAGQMVTAYALSFAILAPVMAAVAGLWPRKLLLVCALAIFVVGNAITALATNIGMVLFARVLAGLGAAMFSPTALGVAASITPQERRGTALSIVTAGLAGATALGAPLGTFIGALGSWRTTLWFVAVVGLVVMIGLWVLLHALPRPTKISLRERIAPLSDLRVVAVLLSVFFAFGGALMVYTYVGLVLDRVTGGDRSVLAGFLLLWGVAATCGNLLSGRMVDRFGSRRVINAAYTIASINFLLLPWTSSNAVTAAVALILWAFCGWGALVPHQHRLVKIAPHVAPLVLALNNSATYAGLACSGVLGGVVILVIDHHYLSWIAVLALILSLCFAEFAHRLIMRGLESDRLDAAHFQTT